MNELIERLDSHGMEKSGLLYFLDHGEEVFGTRNFKVHEPTNFSRPMFDVPMFVRQIIVVLS